MDSATQIAEISAPHNGSDIVLDFSEVTFLDSIGIWALVNLAAGLEGGGKLVVAHANGAVKRTLEMADVPAIAAIVLRD